MAKTRDKLDRLDQSIRKQWIHLESESTLTTREKLDRLVRSRLPDPAGLDPGPVMPSVFPREIPPFVEREYFYADTTRLGRFTIGDLRKLRPVELEILAGDAGWRGIDAGGMLFFDTETTGLAGGTGTVAFMLGFGFLVDGGFQVHIFVLSDLNRENEFLDRVDAFLCERSPSAGVTYNGKCFDYPLMETRYILQRRRFPLLSLPHLDFLYPARTLWRHTYPSRRLGYLGDMLLGLSREEDVDGSEIPRLYFDFLRTGELAVLDAVMEHNALDLLGLAMLVNLGARCLEDMSHTRDEGEILGTARLLENAGELDKAAERLETIRVAAERPDVQALALRRLSRIRKKKKLYDEALALWEEMRQMGDPQAVRELSIHYEHRERDFQRALSLVRDALKSSDLSSPQQLDLERRLQRLTRKLARLDSGDGP
ncbi:MAG: ribonuclease H-like domain-containing protein [Candidatus Aminicenantes bacterium]|nr:ribonuclease H-like domain-containing protein [Candidatus Aminicenantes bacterium]